MNCLEGRHPERSEGSLYLHSPGGATKKQLKNVAHLSTAKNTRPKHHIHHTFHHDLTTNLPSKNHPILQNTPQKP